MLQKLEVNRGASTSEESIKLAVDFIDRIQFRGLNFINCVGAYEGRHNFVPIIQSGYLRQNLVHTPCCKIYLRLV